MVIPIAFAKLLNVQTGMKKKGKLPYGKGIGIAGSHYVSGAANSIIRSTIPHSNVMLKLDIDGGVTIYTGTAEIGQGSDTVQVQIVAEELDSLWIAFELFPQILILRHWILEVIPAA